MEVFAMGGTSSDESSSRAKMRPRASKVATLSISEIGAAEPRSLDRASSRLSIGERGAVVIAGLVLQEMLCNGVGIVEIQHGEPRGLGQLQGAVGGDGGNEGIVRILHWLAGRGAP